MEGEVRNEPARMRFRGLFREIVWKCDLPPFPKVATRALALARNPCARTDDVARVVAADPALATRVLHIANSVVYAKRDPPATVRDAIITVGFDTLRALLITASARLLYDGRDPVAETLWAHALATALAADELRHPHEPSGGKAFIAGLLHDVGKLVFHITDPAAFARLGYADEEGERATFGVSHAVASGVLADMWSAPPGVAEAIIEHHTRPACGLAGRLRVADWIAHAIGHGSVPGKLPPCEPVDPPVGDLEDVSARVARAFQRARASFD
jgi:HD-like signal output (HDOD) protein